jgi:ankyrin repeat protein
MMMDLLYQENPDAINSMDYNGNTPLHVKYLFFSFSSFGLLIYSSSIGCLQNIQL